VAVLPAAGGGVLHSSWRPARLYSALLVFYPKAFRQRYAAEMRTDFFELLWEGLQEGGSKEFVRVGGRGDHASADAGFVLSRQVPFSTSCHLPTASLVRDDLLDTARRVYWGAKRLRSCSKSEAKGTQKRDR
jgi:hypothetical protein